MSFINLNKPLIFNPLICSPFNECFEEQFSRINPPFRPSFFWIDNLSNFIIDNFGDNIIFE